MTDICMSSVGCGAQTLRLNKGKVLPQLAPDWEGPNYFQTTGTQL